MSDPAHALRLTAAYFRAALDVGLVTPEHVIAWADGAIERGASLPGALYQVSLAATSGTGLRNALSELSPAPTSEAESTAVARALLDSVWQDLRSARRPLDHAMTSLRALRRRVVLPDELRFRLIALDEDYYLAREGVTDELTTIESTVRTWLAQFDGALPALLEGAA